MIDVPTLETMARQHGVVSRRQLLSELGWSKSKFGRYRSAGVFVDVAPGVVRLASDRPTFESLCMATQLAADGIGFVSSWSAGRLAGLRRMPRLPVHYTGPTRLQLRFPEWVETHRSRWYDESDVVIRADGLRVATPLRALFGMAAAFNQFRFERAAEDAWHLGLLDPASAADYLERHRCRGKDGVSTMERWLERCDGLHRPAHSGLEQELLAALDRVGLPSPLRQHPLRLANGESIHFDLAWPDVRLAVEPGHSWWHGGDLRQRLDQDRDRGCSELGWLVVRFDETMLRDLDEAARQIRRIHVRRSADLRNVLDPTR